MGVLNLINIYIYIYIYITLMKFNASLCRMDLSRLYDFDSRQITCIISQVGAYLDAAFVPRVIYQDVNGILTEDALTPTEWDTMKRYTNSNYEMKNPIILHANLSGMYRPIYLQLIIVCNLVNIVLAIWMMIGFAASSIYGCQLWFEVPFLTKLHITYAFQFGRYVWM